MRFLRESAVFVNVLTSVHTTVARHLSTGHCTSAEVLVNTALYYIAH
jgi:hypothetical protein